MCDEHGASGLAKGSEPKRRRDVAKILERLGNAAVAGATVAYEVGATTPTIVAGVVAVASYTAAAACSAVRPRS
jgi:hypothetical protein